MKVWSPLTENGFSKVHLINKKTNISRICISSSSPHSALPREKGAIDCFMQRIMMRSVRVIVLGHHIAATMMFRSVSIRSFRTVAITHRPKIRYPLDEWTSSPPKQSFNEMSESVLGGLRALSLLCFAFSHQYS